jgi:hypothetical protein
VRFSFRRNPNETINYLKSTQIIDNMITSVQFKVFAQNAVFKHRVAMIDVSVSLFGLCAMGCRVFGFSRREANVNGCLEPAERLSRADARFAELRGF